MPADYTVLAPVYNQIGMAAFAERIISPLINYAQRNEWLGRRILDLGCGTGVAANWMARRSLIPAGIDNAPEMLEIARRENENVRWIEADIREPNASVGTVDMVLALDVVNELNSLRDIELVFQSAYQTLESSKLFMFDMFTIEGLAQTGPGSDRLDNYQDLTVFTNNLYDYERQMLTRHYTIFQREGDLWRRSEARRILRAFPVQAVASLLQRQKFSNIKVLTTEFEPFDPNTSRAPRVIFSAQKD